MKRGLSTALAVAALLNVWALPAGPLAQQPAPALQVSASPDPARVGADLTLTVASPPAGAVRYEWQAGAVTAESQQPVLTTRFSQPGPAPIEVRAFDANASEIGQGQVTVQVRPASEPQGGRLEASASGGDPAKSNKERSKPKPKARDGAGPGRRVVAAAASSVTIKDFSFGPSSVTVHVGDTVSWSNSGPSDHTATANSGSFDTGTLKKGQSGSHTFTSAGTFSYHCTIHPFMHGTVVVAAAGGGGGGSQSSGSSGGAGSSGSTGSSTPAAPAQSAGGLPNTGLDLGWVVLSGVLLLASGLLLRRTTRA